MFELHNNNNNTTSNNNNNNNRRLQMRVMILSFAEGSIAGGPDGPLMTVYDSQDVYVSPGQMQMPCLRPNKPLYCREFVFPEIVASGNLT